MFALLLMTACNSAITPEVIVINYPVNGSIFPPDISSPTIRWSNNQTNTSGYKITITSNTGEIIFNTESHLNYLKIDEQQWSAIKKATQAKSATIEVLDKDNSKKASVEMSTSTDSVSAPIFYRAVPLPFKFARENLEKVSWHLGNISDLNPAPAALENMPVCGNCHSFSGNGATLAMDVDARDEKGAYVIAKLNKTTPLNQTDIINWSDFQKGEFTYGLLSQVSPDGGNVVSTLKDCEIFVDLNNMEYSQLFFPFKGILAVYSKANNRFFALNGADDTVFVHSNPAWSPNGEYIYFCKAKAAMFEESGVQHGSVALSNTTYNNFLNNFIERKKLFKFDIYRIPFNNGNGGVAQPVKGASINGKSNFFPKISPDGKWMVFTQAESFMLLQKDSKLYIVPAEGGEPRLMNCNTNNMNSWHSWSPNGKWIVFASKANGPYTQLFLTHIDERGNDSPPILLEKFVIDGKAANIPEFVNVPPDTKLEIVPAFLEGDDFKLRMAQIHAKKNNIDKALGLFNELLAGDQKNPEALVGRADIYMKKRMTDKAFADFNLAIKLKPTMAAYYISRGTAFGDVRQPEKAINDFSKAIELNPYSFMAYNNRGLIKFRTGRTEEALNDYNKSLELNDRAYMTIVNIGVALAKSNKNEEAMQYFNQATNLSPDQTMAYNAKAILCLQTGKRVEALNNLNKVLEIEPRNVDALNYRSHILEDNADYYNAINDYLQLLIINDNLKDFQQIMALCVRIKDYNLMNDVTERIIKNNIYFGGEVYYYKAIALKKIGKQKEACEAIIKSADNGYKPAKDSLKDFCAN